MAMSLNAEVTTARDLRGICSIQCDKICTDVSCVHLVRPAHAAYAQRVDRDLQANNFKTWRDVRGIDESQDFSGEIEFAIRAASHVVVCLTRDVQVRANSFVRREIAYALNQDAARRQATPRGRLRLLSFRSSFRRESCPF